MRYKTNINTHITVIYFHISKPSQFVCLFFCFVVNVYLIVIILTVDGVVDVVVTVDVVCFTHICLCLFMNLSHLSDFVPTAISTFITVFSLYYRISFFLYTVCSHCCTLFSVGCSYSCYIV